MTTAAFVAVVGTVSGLVIEEAWEDRHADEQASRDDSAQSRVDDAKAPFTTVVTRLAEDEYQPDLLIDRPFTPTELGKLLKLDMQDRGDIGEFYSLMTERGARRINTPSWQTAEPAAVSLYRLNIHSEKDDALTINGLEATDMHCEDEPTAKTVIKFPHQGTISAAGLLLDLDARPRDPINTDQEAPDAGKPYFSHHGITVGGTQAPGLVRLEAATGMARCTFKLRARYTHTDQSPHSAIITDDGQPFVAESYLKRPQQEIVFSIPDRSFVDCSQHWVPGCSDHWK
ncbi:hypothetical protein [Streptomyces pratensis]|uniref:hypothetical protein n=1 Tax=Streptomyces pratensis TaxID=1169025 RepID=UPI00362AC8A2